MTKTMLLATAATLLLSGVAQAADATRPADQAAAVAPVPTGSTSQAPLDDATQKGVLVFQPEFFAAQRPNTALEMVQRVPGFSVNDG